MLLLPPERHLLAGVAYLLPVVVRIDTVMILALARCGHNEGPLGVRLRSRANRDRGGDAGLFAVLGCDQVAILERIRNGHLAHVDH